jgi:protein transport protein SEC13
MPSEEHNFNIVEDWLIAALQVIAWVEQPDATWQKRLVHDFKVPVWRVSWSITGNILAVSDSNNAVTLWKETLDGVWQQISQ